MRSGEISRGCYALNSLLLKQKCIYLGTLRVTLNKT